MEYKIIFDDGKPYEETATSPQELKEKLKAFYIRQTDEGNADFDARVFLNDSIGYEEITESQYITELVGEIYDEVEQC